jgi:hypothetical protein
MAILKERRVAGRDLKRSRGRRGGEAEMWRDNGVEA